VHTSFANFWKVCTLLSCELFSWCTPDLLQCSVSALPTFRRWILESVFLSNLLLVLVFVVIDTHFLCRAASQFHGTDWPWLFCLVCLPVLTFPGMLFRLLTIRRHGSAPCSQHLANSGICWYVLASGVWMVPVLSWRLLRSRTKLDCPSIFRITEKSWQQKSRSWSGRSLELQMISLVRLKLNKCYNLSCSM
jgi:hypothetical protein